MNSGQYHHQPQNQGLPLTFQFTESPNSSLQSAHRLFSFDGLPRMQSDQNFMTPSSTSNIAPGSYSLVNPMSISQASLPWADQTHIGSNFEDQNTNDYYDYSPNPTSNAPDGPFLRGVTFDIPRWMPDDMRVHSDNHMSLENYEHPMYRIDHNEPDAHFSPPIRSTTAYSTIDNSRDFARLSIDTSPKIELDIMGGRTLFDKPSPFRQPSSETSEDGGNSSREMTAVEGNEPAVDEPYAKLIYRALMSAPNHSMVLQEIYQWFRENTVRGSSDTKGWMNSIRHNLSMNAAFKKTERKIPGDETKKSTEWVLEDFAIKDGVQSTTRYRKGTNAKKFMKTDNPAPARQKSGQIRGKSIPSRFSRQRFEKARSLSRQPTPRIGMPPRMVQLGRIHPTQRQRSPLTPPHPEHVLSSSPSPYFFPKPEQFDMPFEDMCGLEDVQGVYIDDGPLFTNEHEPHFHNGHLMSNHPY